MNRRKTGAFNGGFSPNGPTEIHPIRARGVVEPVDCREVGCGDADAFDLWSPSERPPGWVFVFVNHSTEPGRWYCSGECARRGMAIAELRVQITPGGVS